VPIQRAKPVETLYDEVAGYDLVLTPDAPLASAINRRLDVPHFGTFATTPRRLAAGRREQAEDRSAFLEVVDRTDHDWKSVSYAVGNTLQCWEHQGSIESILAYDAYVDDATEAVVDIMADLLERADVPAADPLPDGVRLTERDGYTWVTNFGRDPVEVNAGDAAVVVGDATVPGRDVAVVEGPAHDVAVETGD